MSDFTVNEKLTILAAIRCYEIMHGIDASAIELKQKIKKSLHQESAQGDYKTQVNNNMNIGACKDGDKN